jgi:hypothetical protein
MKRIFILSILLVSLQAFSQEISFKGSYKFTTSEIKELSPQKIKGSDTLVEIPDGAKIRVIGTSDDGTVIHYRYWLYPEGSSNGAIYNGEIFTMLTDNFIHYTQPLYSVYKGASVGMYTVPIRVRGRSDDFDFESSFSLQSNISFGFGLRKNKESLIDAAAGIGVSSINLNLNNSIVTENRSATALTYSFGFILKPNPNTNIGLFSGRDFLGRNDRNIDWVHHGKRWIGIGVNISFIPVSTTNTATGNSQKN